MSKEITEHDIAECYQPLFDLMLTEHGLTLTVSEMNEIITSANEVRKLIKELIDRP